MCKKNLNDSSQQADYPDRASDERDGVSVIIPYHNAHQTIERAVNSTLAQSNISLEIVIINDGSSNCGTQKLSAFRETPGIRVIDILNRGAAAARNIGVRNSRYNFLAFLDADDEFSPDIFSKKIKALKGRPDVGLVFGRVRIRNSENAFRKHISPLYAELTVENVLGSFPVLTTSNMFVRRQAFEDVGDFNEALKRASDQEWTARLCLHDKWQALGIDEVAVDKYVSHFSLWANVPALKNASRCVAAALCAKGFSFNAHQRSMIAGKLNSRAKEYALRYGGLHDSVRLFESPALVAPIDYWGKT